IDMSPHASTASSLSITGSREAGDSLGGVVEIRADRVPAGLGDPVMDKLEAVLAWGLMSIGAVKGFEVGDGFAASRRRGSEMNDRMTPGGFASNHAGGILGGISTGEPIVCRIAVKPPSSIAIPQKTVDVQGKEREAEILGTIGSAGMNQELFRSQIRKAKALTKRRFAVNIPLLRADAAELLEIALAEGIEVIITSAGNPAVLGPRVRKAPGVLWIHVVPSVKHGLKAQD